MMDKNSNTVLGFFVDFFKKNFKYIGFNSNVISELFIQILNW